MNMIHESDEYLYNEGDLVWYNTYDNEHKPGTIVGIGFKNGNRVYDVDCADGSYWGYEYQFSKR